MIFKLRVLFSSLKLGILLPQNHKTSPETSGEKGSTNRTMQMIERPLMTVDELKSMPKGHFVVMKTGCYPMKTRLQLFFKWGISFEETYSVSEKSARKVNYADKCELERAILRKYPPKVEADMFDEPTDTAVSKKRVRTAKNEK